MTRWEYIALVALCAASISYTITWAGIFSKVRDIVSKWGKWFDDLIHCPYCFCHYVILAIMLTTRHIGDYLVRITDVGLYNFLFTWFVIVCLTSLLHAVMLIAYKPVAEVETFRRLKTEREKENQSS